jgi:hypothetical protein
MATREAWWACHWRDRYKQVWLTFQKLFADQYEVRKARAEAALFLYYGSGRLTLGGRTSYFDILAGEEPPHFNAIQAAVDAKTAQIYRNAVRPFHQTERGSRELRERAEGMTRAIEGGFRDAGIYGLLGFLVCQDGHLFEAGGVMSMPDFANSRVIDSRVRAWECFVPEREARLGNPTQMFIRTLVDRAVLRSIFGDDADALDVIEAATAVGASWDEEAPTDDGEISDLIEVCTGWHLPSGRTDLRREATFGLNDEGEYDPELDTGHDGRYSITLENGTLWDRPWPYDYFPIAWYKPSPNPVGYWSRSIPETLAGAQLELLKIAKRIQGIMHMHSVPRLLLWRNARANTAHFNNDYANIIETAVPPGQAAYYLTPSAVPSELFQREQEIIDWCARQVGLNDMAMSGTKPAGVDHAPGMEHLSDELAVRHSASFRAWEQFHQDLARIRADCYRQLAEYDPEFSVMWGESKDLVKLRWKDVDMERDQYQLRVSPTNMFAQTPTAKINQINSMVQSGVLPQPLALMAFSGSPDVDALVGDQNAEEQNIEKKLDQLSKPGAQMTDKLMPHPYMNLALCKQLAKQRINRLEADGESQEAIDNVVEFWEIADDFEKQGTATQVQAEEGIAPPMDMPPGAGGMPPGMPPAPMGAN